MLIPTPSVSLTVPVVPGDYTTEPLDLGVVQFTHPEPYTSSVVDEIVLRYEHPQYEPAYRLESEDAYSLSQYRSTTLEFYRRYDQWFVTVLTRGRGIPFVPFHLLLTHFDRPNRKVYYTRGLLTLTRYV